MIIRGPRSARYTSINNAVIEDAELSWKAKGLLIYILSKPDHWTVNERQLAAAGKDGRDAVSSGMKELEAAGYVRRERGRSADGTFTWATWVWDERNPPLSENPPTRPENPTQVNPAQGKPVLVITEGVTTDVVTSSNELEGRGGESVEVLPLIPEVVPSRQATARKRDELWDAVCEVQGIPEGQKHTKAEAREIGQLVSELRAVGATPDELRQKVMAHRVRWPDWEPTLRSVLKRWGQLTVDNALAPRPSQQEVESMAYLARRQAARAAGSQQ